MKDLIIIIVIVCAVSIFESTTHSASPKTMGTIRVQISNLRNDKGNVRISLFRTDNGFPSETEKAFKIASAPINNKTSTIVFDNVPPGDYAIALLHDENDNNKMDTNFMGIPKEGYGVSNNVKATLRAPSFEDAKFSLEKGAIELPVNIRYF